MLVNVKKYAQSCTEHRNSKQKQNKTKTMENLGEIETMQKDKASSVFPLINQGRHCIHKTKIAS